MQTILDIIFSTVIGGVMLLTLHSLNTRLTTASSAKAMTTSVHQNMSTVTDVLEYDLRKVGYNNIGAPHFKQAESTRVYIRADFNNDNSPDSVLYYLGTTADPSQTNPRARILYRAYNGGDAVQIRAGVTRFQLWYYDQGGNPLPTTPGVSNPSLIRNVKVTLNMDVGSSIETARLPNGSIRRDTTFSSASWEKMLKPVNLR